jgi:hypothetical protein
MTRHRLLHFLVALAGLLIGSAGQATAQYPYGRPPTNPYARSNPYARPALSPYLNLARGGDPAINYYGLVRPEQQFASAIQQLGQQISANQQQVNDLEDATLPTTGHPAQFMNTSHYFQNLSGRPQGRTPAKTTPPPEQSSAPRRGTPRGGK